jgi:hypothetical protein
MARGRVAKARAMLLAAGEAVGVVALAALQAEAGEQLAGPRFGLGARHAVPLNQAEEHVVEDVQVREEVVGLENEAEAAAHRHRVHGGVGDHLAVQEDVAVVDLLEQVDAAQKRRLARPGGADQRDRLVFVDGEIDAAQDLELAEGLGDAPDLDDRLAGAHERALPRSQRSSRRAHGIVTSRYMSAAPRSGV